MKVLFLMDSPEYLRFYDSAIEELARRGHEVAISVNNQRDKKPVTGKDAEVLSAWNELSKEELATKKRSSQARQKAMSETSLAIGSLTAPGRPDVDVKGMDVEIASKQVTIDAQVKSPDGQTTTPKTMVFTFQRAVAKKDGQTTEGRWIITNMQQDGGPAKASS